MRKKLHIWKKGMIFLLTALMAAGMLPTMSFATTEETQVDIASITETDGTVNVSGTTKNLSARKVEVIVNNDLDLRYVAENDENGNWNCEFQLPYNGEYSVEASIRDYSDFNQIRQVTPDDNYLEIEDACVWGASVVRHTDGLYYMVFSTWDEKDTFNRWYNCSQLGYAVSTKVGGPYIYQGKALDTSFCNVTNSEPLNWGDGVIDVFHNPNLMYSKKEGKYYLYFMGKPIGGIQRIGVAYADSPAGPWTIKKEPVIDIRAGYHDESYVCNPSVIEIEKENGEYLYYAVYRANGPTQKASGYAIATSPEGPFTQSEHPIMVNEKVEFSVEDCYIWVNNGKLYALAKDMSKGDLTGYTEGYSYALYESTDGVNWPLSDNALAFPAVVPWESGEKKVAHLERSQLYIEDSIPFMIFNASTVNGGSPYTAGNHSCNIHIPLLGVLMSNDTKTLTVTSQQEKAVHTEKLQQLLAEARQAVKGYYTTDTWSALYSARRAGEILLIREGVEQSDIDFVTEKLEKLLPQQIDPLTSPINIALKKYVKASSNYANSTVGSFPAENAVDGDPSTRWSAANGVSGTVTYEIDLNGKYDLDNFELTKFDDRITAYNWQYYNGTEWKECFSASNGELNGKFSCPEPAEKVKLNITEYKNPPSLYEIKVYGISVGENIVYNKSVTASSNYSNSTVGSYPAENAVDGDPSTRWSAANSVSGTVTYEIDLNGKYDLDNFELTKFDDRITAYNWQYYNGTEWKECFSTSKGEMSGEFSCPETAEKLKLSITGYNKPPTLFEIKVFGTLVSGNVVRNKPVYASSNYFSSTVGSYPAENALDGNASTRWSAASGVQGTIYFDINLNGKYYLNNFKLSQFAARITEYSWEYYDGTKWQTCYNGTATTETKDISGNFIGSEVAERIRLKLLQYTKEPSIFEIEVNGSYVRCEGVALSETSLQLKAGESHPLSVIISPDNAICKDVSWTSSDSAVATVSENGWVTAVGSGDADITVTCKEGEYTATCKVQVTLDTTALQEAVQKLKEQTADLEVFDIPAEQVHDGIRFVSSEDKSALNLAISNAESALNTVKTVEELQLAQTALETAVQAVNIQIGSGHTADDLEIDVPATCAKAGVGHKNCTVCGQVVQSDIEIPTIPHTAGAWKTVTEPSYAKEGKSQQYCSVCNALLSSKVLSKSKGINTLTVFKDIQSKDWFVKNGSIDYAYNMNFFKGTTKSTFAPNATVTRGMFVTVLGRLHGVKDIRSNTQFDDVRKNAYYSGFVAWAAKNGIVMGTSATTFAPDSFITREQICTMMYRYCSYSGTQLKNIHTAVTFVDVNQISNYAKKAVSACQTGAIVNGKSGGKFDPKGNATRAEVATILMNFHKNYK